MKNNVSCLALQVIRQLLLRMNSVKVPITLLRDMVKFTAFDLVVEVVAGHDLEVLCLHSFPIVGVRSEPYFRGLCSSV